MNELISMLQKKGVPTVGRLKRLYRRLSKRTHPDIAHDSHEAFLKLKCSYEEALSMLAEPVQEPEKAENPEDAATGDQRLAVMKSLYRYALKFNGLETDRVFSTLLEQTRNYKPKIYLELVTYQEIFLRTYGQWRNNANVYFAHSLWIACIRELAYYLSYGQARHLSLLNAYCKDLIKQTEKLEQLQRGTLRRLSQWLLTEAQGNKLQIIEES